MDNSNVPFEAALNLTTFGFASYFPDVYAHYGDRNLTMKLHVAKPPKVKIGFDNKAETSMDGILSLFINTEEVVGLTFEAYLDLHVKIDVNSLILSLFKGECKDLKLIASSISQKHMKLGDFAKRLTKLLYLQIPRINNNFLNAYQIKLTPFDNVELVGPRQAKLSVDRFLKFSTDFQVHDFPPQPFGTQPGMKMKLKDSVAN